MEEKTLCYRIGVLPKRRGQVELRTLRTNQQNSDQKTILKGLNTHYQTNFKFLFVRDVRRMGSSTFVPETILRHKQTDGTCWTIQTRSDELNWARGRSYHEPNSLSLVRLMKSSTFSLGLSQQIKMFSDPFLTVPRGGIFRENFIKQKSKM